MDKSRSMGKRVLDMVELNKSYTPTITATDVEITRVQNLRSPLDQKANAAMTDFYIWQQKAMDAVKGDLNQAGGNTRRRLEDKSRYVPQLEVLMTDFYNKFKDQYELNFVFHKSEFLQFARDEQYLEDSKANWEKSNDGHIEKTIRQEAIRRKYAADMGPIRAEVGKFNKARQNAQRTKGEAERKMWGFITGHQMWFAK